MAQPNLAFGTTAAGAVTISIVTGGALALGLDGAFATRTLVTCAALVALAAWLARRHLRAESFGAANSVTLVRLALIAPLVGLLGEEPSAALAWLAIAIAGGVLVLDGIDGWLARRYAGRSDFGARFDMETDALLILVLSALCYHFDKAGAWILAAGLMRYAFVGAGRLWPWMSAALPASRRRQIVCVVQIATLLVCLAPPVARPTSDIVGALGLAMLAGSFVADVRWLANRAGHMRGSGFSRASAGGHESIAAIREWTLLALALYVLNFALTFHNVWPTPWITTRHELSIEIAALVSILALFARFERRLPARAQTALALVLTLMTIGRYAEVTAPALYGRAVNLYWDAQYLPNVAAMLVEVANPLLLAGLAIAFVAALAGVFLILRTALARVATSVERPTGQRTLGVVAAVLVAAYALGYTQLPLRTLQYFSLPVTRTYWQQAEFIAAAFAEASAPQSLPFGDPLGPSPLPRIDGADVVVHFVESYGAVAYDVPEIAAIVASGRAELAAAIAATGREAVSAFVTSPTFGGTSWLAHSSFMTGLDIRDNGGYNLLLTQDRATLPKRFAALGHRPLALMPGLRNEWPEGAFYGFERIYGARALDYGGPEFGWWRIPDQFALARLAALEMDAASRAPVFVFFATISTHMPFRPVPPYQPSWDRVLSDEPYDAVRLETPLAGYAEWTHMRPAYAETLAYTFTYVGGFLRAHADANLVWIMLGDHQPAANVTGEGARWDVPVHVVTKDAAITAALLERGFMAGLTPGSTSLGPMHELPVLLLDAFGAR
jgi:phosphatidylglycerophosphate synthase